MRNQIKIIMHIGQQLKKAIKRLGLKKIVLARDLHTSRVTLDKHIKDGNFTTEQTATVNEIINHYKEVITNGTK